jgi:1-deoxy-D-xylulose-5-phosphate synthase
VTFAAGMACEGVKPVVAIYSTFLQRGYDQLIHDVALQNLPVVFALDRAGLVGADGATHAGAYDLAFLRCIPNMVVLAPSDENECRQMLYTAYCHEGPSAVRYPRGSGVGAEVVKAFTRLPFGKGLVRRTGQRIAFLAFGSMVHPALAAGHALDATVVDMRWVKPVDDALIEELARTHDAFVTVEEHAIMGGAGSACLEAMAARGVQRPVLQLGLRDLFIDHGDPSLLLKLEGLDAEGIERSVRALFADLLGSTETAASPRLVASR